MKTSVKDINRLLVWLFAASWCFLQFITHTDDAVLQTPAVSVPEKYFAESTLHKKYPAALSSFESPQVYVQGRNVTDKGKQSSKYALAGTCISFFAAATIVTHFFQFQYTHFFRYLFILYCVLLI